MPITISDIATEAGVSRATVSGVLNKNPNVAEKTRLKVLAIIEKHNFRPNEIARALALRQTGLIGLIVKDISNPVYSKISLGVSDTCEAAGYNLVMGNTHTEPERELEYLNLLQRRRVDGLIILPLQSEIDLSVYKELNNENAPLVLLADLPGLRADLVRSNDEQGAFDATNHLIQRGCRNPMYFSGPETFLASQRRMHGFKRALREANLPADQKTVQTAGWRLEDGYRAGRLLVENGCDCPDGIFCYNDTVAIGLMRAMSEAGISVPKQTAVVGFDDSGVSAYLETSLTTVAQPAIEIGKKAAQLLLEKIQYEGDDWEPQQHYLPTQLIVRESCGAFPKGKAKISI